MWNKICLSYDFGENEARVAFSGEVSDLIRDPVTKPNMQGITFSFGSFFLYCSSLASLQTFVWRGLLLRFGVDIHAAAAERLESHSIERLSAAHHCGHLGYFVANPAINATLRLQGNHIGYGL